MDDKNKVNEIAKIFHLTNREFIDELMHQTANNFSMQFNYIKDKQILFLDDDTYSNTNLLIKNKLILSNNKIYCYWKDKVQWLDINKNRIIDIKELKKISFDYVVCGCLFFDKSANVQLSEHVNELLMHINIKEIIVYALNMQMISIVRNKQNIKMHIVTNNFIINNKK